MANRDNAYGLKPRYHPSGTVRAEKIQLKSTNSAIGIHSALAQQTDGTYDLWSSGRIDAVAAEAAAANDAGTIMAYTDPAIVYSAQCDDTTGILTVQDGMTLNATIVNNTATNGRSIAEIDESSGDLTATLPVKIIGLLDSTGNALGQFNQLLFVLNNTARKGGTGTVGV